MTQARTSLAPSEGTDGDLSGPEDLKEQVREIRKLIGTKPMREIAEMYGVPQGKIHHIKYGNAHSYVV